MSVDLDSADQDFREAMHLNRRQISEAQLRKFEIQAHHLCTEMRGVHELSPLTRTTLSGGAYDTHPELRPEFYVACGSKR